MQKNTLLILTTIATAAVSRYRAAYVAGKQPTVADLICDIKSALWREIPADTPDGSDYENIVCGIVPQTSAQSIKVGEYVKAAKGLDKNIAKIILGLKLIDGERYIPVDFDLQKEMEEFKDSFISEINKHQ